MKRLFAALLFIAACDQPPVDDAAVAPPSQPTVMLRGPAKMDKEVVSIQQAVGGNVRIEINYRINLDRFWDADNINMPWNSPYTQGQECSDIQVTALEIYDPALPIPLRTLASERAIAAPTIGFVGAYMPEHIGVISCTYSKAFLIPANKHVEIIWSPWCSAGVHGGQLAATLPGGGASRYLYGDFIIPGPQNTVSRNYFFSWVGAYNAKSWWKGMLNFCGIDTLFYEVTTQLSRPTRSCIAGMGCIISTISVPWN